MVADDAEPVASKFLDKIGYCAPFEFMGGYREEENIWLVFEGIEQTLYSRLLNSSSAEEFDEILNSEVNGKKDIRYYEWNSDEKRFEYMW